MGIPSVGWVGGYLGYFMYLYTKHQDEIEAQTLSFKFKGSNRNVI